ncbi:hypothetical protein ATANTOWER_011281 [Ataeniobius toweri]|uniref:Uncharacterized protein n=1 Tax=Ataeniobius toweri TaxID=208326 RepID=A0ABU7A5N4_9TELE|nr:hypothetical protein [Ataeniobius toweri]
MALDALTPASVHSLRLPQIFEWISPDNPLKVLVFPVACSPLPITLLPSTQFSTNMLGYRTLRTTFFFSNDCLWLPLLVKGVGKRLLDICQVGSLPHDCVTYDPE